MIRLINISKSYQRNKKLVLNNVNMEIESEKIIGIIGENGAGKTTLVKVITGLIIPSSGEVYYDDKILEQKSVRNIYKEASVVLDGGRSLQWRLSVRDNFQYYSCIKNIPADKIKENTEKYMSYFGMEELLNKKVRELSLGQKQITAVICALISESKYLFLDEPTNGLDLETKCSLIEALKIIRNNFNHTIVITSHDLEFLLSVVDECIVMDQGNIIKTVDLKSENYESCYKYYKESFFS